MIFTKLRSIRHYSDIRAVCSAADQFGDKGIYYDDN